MLIRRRVGLPTMYFHAMNRGARKLTMFLDDEDRLLFLDLLRRTARKYGLSVLVWCLMPNHYHVTVEGDGDSLCAMMRDLDRTYAQSFNRRHGSAGCLFQGRFKCSAPGDAPGLLYVSRYIHANSIDLGYRPEEYRWSSCRSYLGLEKAPHWLNTGPVLATLREPGKSVIEAYTKYMAAAPPKRRKPRPDADEFEIFGMEFIRHLEERYTERIQGLAGLPAWFTVQNLVCWAARREHRIPLDLIAEFYGYAGASSVKTTICKFQRRLNLSPEIPARLGMVTISTA